MFKSLFLMLLTLNVFAQSDYQDAPGLQVVAVGSAQKELSKIAIGPIVYSGSPTSVQKKTLQNIGALFGNDFAFYLKIFDVRAKEAQELVTTVSASTEEAKKSDYHIAFDSVVGAKEIHLEISLIKVATKEKLVTRKIDVTEKGYREEAHQVADEMFTMITKKPSIFKSKITFVSTHGGGDGTWDYKELYIMDFDGENKKQLTHHRSNVISPDISYDGTKILYSVMKVSKRHKNVDLYMYDLKKNDFRIISAKKGINSGGIFLPGDQEIYLTLTVDGNAEIYKMNLNTKALTRITNHFSDDVDPSTNFTGNLMAFLSGRPGKAMIYTLDPSGTEKNVERISFVGSFNATPRFSPDGKQIVFAAWPENQFDIYRINTDKTGLYRITKNFGSNEEPTFSSDGEFIAFSSQRVISTKSADQQIYIMDKDGEVLGSLTRKFGNCFSPKWSK